MYTGKKKIAISRNPAHGLPLNFKEIINGFQEKSHKRIKIGEDKRSAEITHKCHVEKCNFTAAFVKLGDKRKSKLEKE